MPELEARVRLRSFVDAQTGSDFLLAVAAQRAVKRAQNDVQPMAARIGLDPVAGEARTSGLSPKRLPEG